MEKNKFFRFLAFMIFTFFVNVTSSQNSISFIGGITGEKSYGGLANYSYTFNNSNFDLGLNYSIFEDTQLEGEKVRFNNTLLQLGYSHTILRNRSNSININLGLGALAGFESIEENPKLILKSKSGFVAGAYGSCQLDFFVSDNFGFVLRYQQNYFGKSTTGNTNPFAGAGLKFNF